MTPDELFAAPDEGDPPLDLSELGGMVNARPQSPPQQPANQPAAKGSRWKEFGPLLALLPIAAAKGGRVGVASLLQGFQQAQQRQQQQQRQSEMDARQQAQQDEAASYRRDALAQSQSTAGVQARARQQAAAQAVMRDVTAGLSTATTEEEAQSFVEQMIPVAQQAGIRADVLRGMAKRMVTPTVTQQRRAQKALDSLRKTIGNDLEGVTVSFDGDNITADQLAEIATGVRVTRAPKEPKADENLDKSGLDVQLAYWTRRAAAGDPDATAQVKILTDTIAKADSLRRDPRAPQTAVFLQGPDGWYRGDRAAGTVTPVTAPSGQQLGPPATAASRMAMAESEAGLALIDDIEKLFSPAYVGPVVGRTTKAQMVLPGPDVDPAVATFYASVATLRNEIIKLMSGAAVSGSEEIRMKEQIPDTTQKPNVFRANLAATRKNRETLLARIAARTGQTPQAKVGGTEISPPRKIGRFSVEVEP